MKAPYLSAPMRSKGRSFSIFVLAIAFAFDSSLGYLLAPAEIGSYGASIVLLGGIAQTFGHIAVPGVALAIWAIVTWVRTRSLPDNFARNAAFVLTAFLAFGIASRLFL